MQPVGQLDEQHANVFGHCEQEFAQIFRRALILGHGFDLAQLGHTVDQPRHLFTKVIFDVFYRSERIFDRIMEQRSHDRFLIELQVGHQPGNFHRMAEIGIAAGALLAAMLLHRVDIGTVEQRLIGVRVIV